MGTRSRQQPSSVSCYATATLTWLGRSVVGLILFPSLGYLVETDGFEPPRFLKDRFTVCCNQPLCHVSGLCINYTMIYVLSQV